MKRPWWVDLLRKVHADQRGAVSLETILVIGVIALPVLIFLYRVGIPLVYGWFNRGMGELEAERANITQ